MVFVALLLKITIFRFDDFQEAVMMILNASHVDPVKVRDDSHLGRAIKEYVCSHGGLYPLCSIVYGSEPHIFQLKTFSLLIEGLTKYMVAECFFLSL